MKFFRLDLLTLLISLFILNSCKNQGTIGLGVGSSTQLNGALVDTATINTNTVLDDSVATGGSVTVAKNPFGYFTDPVFGLTQSDLATNISLPATGYVAPSGTVVIDSARLVLSLTDGFYGDSLTSTYKANVYQLNEQYSQSTVYYGNKKWNVNFNTLLGSVTFNSRTHEPMKIFDILQGVPDTLKKVSPQIRIPINTNFINSNYFAASTTTLSNNNIFQSIVKGLYITIDNTKSTGPGGIFMVKPTDTLAVYYHSTSGTTIDTSVTYLQISSVSSAIKHTYSASINVELNNTSASRNTIYLQGLSGLRAKISFPNLLANIRNGLIKKDSDIIINRAELVVTPVAGTTIPYLPSPKLTLYRYDIALQRIYAEDASTADPRAGGISVFGGYYSTVTKSYHFILTAFLQDLLLKRTNDYGTYIAPIDTTNKSTVDINATPSVGSRVVVGGGANKSSPYNMKLNIIYTKISSPH